jgi:hypothetical protein
MLNYAAPPQVCPPFSVHNTLNASPPLQLIAFLIRKSRSLHALPPRVTLLFVTPLLSMHVGTLLLSMPMHALAFRNLLANFDTQQRRYLADPHPPYLPCSHHVANLGYNKNLNGSLRLSPMGTPYIKMGVK